MINKIKHIYFSQTKIITYLLIGLISVSLDFLIFKICITILSINYFESNIISVHFGIVNSFILNRHYNFKIKNSAGVRFLVFYCVGIFGILISSIILFAFVEIIKINPLYSKLISIVLVAFIQFYLNSKITFKNNINE